MGKAIIETLASVVERSFQATLSEAGKVPQGNQLRQTAPGKAHPMWLYGHLAGSSDMLGGYWMLGSKAILDGSFRKKFAPDFMRGDPITDNPGDYPDWDHVVKCYEQSMTRLLGLIHALDDGQLTDPPHGPMPEELKKLIPTLGSGITLLALHDSHHRGQIALLSHL